MAQLLYTFVVYPQKYLKHNPPHLPPKIDNQIFLYAGRSNPAGSLYLRFPNPVEISYSQYNLTQLKLTLSRVVAFFCISLCRLKFYLIQVTWLTRFQCAILLIIFFLCKLHVILKKVIMFDIYILMILNFEELGLDGIITSGSKN